MMLEELTMALVALTIILVILTAVLSAVSWKSFRESIAMTMAVNELKDAITDLDLTERASAAITWLGSGGPRGGSEEALESIEQIRKQAADERVINMKRDGFRRR